ncbi:MAG: FAD-dependent oxidoreductase [Halanaerobiales bacterium]|nr:FAD-dependent oxidoreductase [Halanaerobiales bacterium]
MLSNELQERMEEVIEDCMGDAPAPCVATCPLHIDAKGYVNLIKEGKYKEALSLIRETTPFPGILGRVCAHPCEEECNRQDIEEALSVKNLKRFAAEFDDIKDWDISTKEDTGKEIAIIGSGPAGATAAYDLQKEGHQVTIFEKLPVVGGMLRVGIPAYRLPHEVIDEEYIILEKLGVKIKLNTEIGKDISFDDIKTDYDAVFIAIGSHNGIMLPIEGSDLKGVQNAVDILRNAGLEDFEKVNIDKKVTIIGGGNVAMDVARTVWRLGAEEIHITCLESEDIMPAHPWEIEDAREEGIIMHPGWGPDKINGDNKVESITLKKCTSVFDEEGNFSPSYDESERMEIETDNVIFAVGQGTKSDFLEDKVNLDRRNNVITDDLTLQTDVEHVFAGGDGIGRPLLAIEAMSHGRKAAVSIDRYLKDENLVVNREFEGSYETWLDKELPEEPEKKRVSVRMIPVEERINNFKEVELPFTEERAKDEADRCLECECKDCVGECEFLDQYCEHPKDLMERLLEDPTDDLSISYFCNLCETCTVYCPNDFELNNIFLDIRRELVQQGKGPLKGHNPVTKFHQPLGFSNIFTSRLKDKNTKDTKRVFFPGCSLSSYAPDVVAETYKYLQENLPGTGFILKCCGAPTNMVGQEDKFEERFNDLINDVRELGAEEIITACPDCTHNIISHKPDDIKVTTVYEVIDEIGLPEDRKDIANGKTISIHDSCTGRHFTELHESVRNLVKDLGLNIQEFEHNREDTRCCGFGGMVLLANKDLSTDIMKRRANETDKDVVTYCGACRESMTIAEKPAFHLLELIFSDQWKNGANDADNPIVQWYKRWQTKKKVEKINS